MTTKTKFEFIKIIVLTFFDYVQYVIIGLVLFIYIY